jgi:hypothetical protein
LFKSVGGKFISLMQKIRRKEGGGSVRKEKQEKK